MLTQAQKPSMLPDPYKPYKYHTFNQIWNGELFDELTDQIIYITFINNERNMSLEINNNPAYIYKRTGEWKEMYQTDYSVIMRCSFLDPKGRDCIVEYKTGMCKIYLDEDHFSVFSNGLVIFNK